MAFSYHQTARIRSHYNSPTIVIIIMMIVSNQIETGKVQYVWMAFSHQTAPRSGSSLNISQILFFLMFLFYPQSMSEIYWSAGATPFIEQKTVNSKH